MIVHNCDRFKKRTWPEDIKVSDDKLLNEN